MFSFCGENNTIPALSVDTFLQDSDHIQQFMIWSAVKLALKMVERKASLVVKALGSKATPSVVAALPAALGEWHMVSKSSTPSALMYKTEGIIKRGLMG